MVKIIATFYGGPYNGSSMEMNDTYCLRVARPMPIALADEETGKPLQYGWYSRVPRTNGWRYVKFQWRGWE